MLAYDQIIIRLLIAAVLGGVVGIERERREWAAGLRTHMLVSLGSALIMIVSAFGFTDALQASNVTLDPSRVAAQVVSGIGFLGAGTILFLRQETIRGLTTAASLWTVAAVGLAVGGGLYVPAVSATLIILVILAVLKPLEQRFLHRHRSGQITVTVAHRRVFFHQLQTAIEAAGLHADQITLTHDEAGAQDRVQCNFDRGAPQEKLYAAAENLREIEGVREVRL